MSFGRVSSTLTLGTISVSYRNKKDLMNQNSRPNKESEINLKITYRLSFENYGINCVRSDSLIHDQSVIEEVDYFLPDLNLFILIASDITKLPKNAVPFASLLEQNAERYSMLVPSSNTNELSECTEMSSPALYIGDANGKIFELLPNGELNEKVYFYRCGECTTYGFQSYASGWLCRSCQSAYSENGRILSWKLKPTEK